MPKKILFASLLVLVLAGTASAQTFTTDNTELMALFYKDSNLWNPTAYVSLPQVQVMLNAIVSKLGAFGLVLGVIFVLMEATRLSFGGDAATLQRTFTLLARAVPVMMVLGLAATSASSYYDLVNAIVYIPISALINVVKGGTSTQVLTQLATSLAQAASAQQAGQMPWWKQILDLDVPALITNFFLIFAFVIAWIMSLYVSIMCALLYALGPICLPFMIFGPFAQIAWNWIKSMIAYPLMGLVGSVALGLLMSSGMLSFSVTSAGAGQYLTSIASSLIVILIMISVPAITTSLFSGVSASPMAAARTLGSAAGGVASVGAVAAGVGLMGAGKATEWASSKGGTAEKVGMAATAMGTTMLHEQFRGVARVTKAATSAFAKDAGTNGPGGSNRGSRQSSSSSDIGAGGMAAQSISQAAPRSSGEVLPAGQTSASQAGSGASLPALSAATGLAAVAASVAGREAAGGSAGMDASQITSRPWSNQIPEWSTEKLHQNMVNYVRVRYDNNYPGTSAAFAEKLQSSEFANARPDIVGAERDSYDGIMGPFMSKVLDQMGLKPAVASSVAEIAGKSRFNYGQNSSAANEALLNDYVRQTYGESEIPAFQQSLEALKARGIGMNQILNGKSEDPVGRLQEATSDIYREAGVAALPAALAGSTSLVSPAVAARRRAEDKIDAQFSDTTSDEFKMYPRSEQIAYMRGVAATANDGQYAQFAYDVQVPDRWMPRPREGQSFAEATLGAMKALMVRQGFIGTKEE